MSRLQQRFAVDEPRNLPQWVISFIVMSKPVSHSVEDVPGGKEPRW
jgi:hypothetical protein